MFRKLIATAPLWTTLPLRLALGIIFIAHGGGKMFGWFGGRGLTAFIGNNPPFAFMRPGWLWMGVAAFSEFFGAILVMAGLLTRVGAFFLACVMLTAMFGSHWGAFFIPRGIEFTVALLAMCISLLITGGGRASVDELLVRGRRR